MTAIKTFFRLPANFPRLNIRANLAKVRKKLLGLKHRKIGRETPTEEQPGQVMSPISPGPTPTTESSDTSSLDRTPLLGSSATTPIPQRCRVVVGRTPRPGPVRPEAGPSSILPENHTSTPGNNTSSNSSFIRNIDLQAADSNGRKETRRTIIDTGSAISIMARDVQEDLGYEMKPHGGLIKPFESKPISILGVVEKVPWNFPDGPRTFVEDFYVVDTDEFDTLIGNKCIGANGILKFDCGEPSTGAE